MEWGATLPRWQQELLRRVLRLRTLTQDDIDELAVAAVSEAEQQPSRFSPLSGADFPSVALVERKCTLRAIQNLRNVNTLSPNQKLTFGPQLTVVYGDNGAGKSGYGRVLKRVYRARVVEPILGDVRTENPSAEIPGATFIVASADGIEQTIDWQDGSTFAGIGRFAVLDSMCAATYIQGGAIGVGPAGIEVPAAFATELDRVKRQLATQSSTVLPNKRALQRLESDTAAGRFVRTLSSSRSDAAISAACTWTAEQDLERVQIERDIREAKAITPGARRSRLQARLKALESIGKRLAAWSDVVMRVDDVKRAVLAVAEAETALRTLQALGDSNASAGLVKGQVWLELLRAANAYVESIAARAHSAGPLSVNGRCVLCWQELDDASAARGKRFKEHLDGAAVTAWNAAQLRLDELVVKIRSVPDSVPPEDTAVIAEDESLVAQVHGLIAALASRRDGLLQMIQNNGPLVDESAVDLTALNAIRTLYGGTKRELMKLPVNNEEAASTLAQLEAQLLELNSRRALAESVDEVRDFVAAMRDHQRFKSARSAINTRNSSEKASELHAKHITERYTRVVDEELVALGFRRRKPILVPKTSKATVEVTPLVSEELKHIPAERVFSEGERTAIALACFLAELRLGDDPSGLIFDDPISSLDHGFREYVARRLVQVAKERQVIIFTHDLAFLADLREQAEKIMDVDCVFRTLTALDQTGFVEDAEPFGARSIGDRISALRRLVVDLERSSKSGQLSEFRAQAREFYEQLRSTFERFIEERLFAKVVRRLERHVMPGALAKVPFTQELGERVHEGWRRCSSVLEAHDHAPSAGAQRYVLDDIRADLQVLLDLAKAVPQG